MPPESAQETEQQEVTTEETETSEGVMASNDATDGESSSDSAPDDSQDEALADILRDEFLAKYGETDPEAEVEAEAKEEAAGESKGARTDESKDKAGDDAKEGGDTEGDDEFRLSDDEFKALSQNARNRIGHLNTRAKKAERQLKELEGQVETFKDAHDRFLTMQTFVQENNIQSEDVDLAFGLAAKLRAGDYRGFLDRITPLVDAARQAVGEAYAPDLRQQVEEGYMTEEAARDLTRARAEAQRAQEEAQRLRQQSQQTQQAQQQQATAHRIISAAQAREAELQSTDPDYAHKREAVETYMKGLLTRGARPQSPEDAVAMVNEAYEFANKTVQKPAPKPATMQSPTASQVSRGRPAPASTKDAIIDALAGYQPTASR